MTRYFVTAAALSILVGQAPAHAQSAQAPAASAPQTVDAKGGQVNGDAQILIDFKKRVDAYMKTHDEAKKGGPPIKQTPDPAAIKVAQDTLGARIRELRADAKQGDIFTPEIVASFRKLLQPPLRSEDGQKTKEVLKDDAPPPQKINFAVNAKYPSSETLPTVPAKVLLHLPPLPKEVEYRIIGKALVLRDVDADIIADFFPNAIP